MYLGYPQIHGGVCPVGDFDFSSGTAICKFFRCSSLLNLHAFLVSHCSLAQSKQRKSHSLRLLLCLQFLKCYSSTVQIAQRPQSQQRKNTLLAISSRLVAHRSQILFIKRHCTVHILCIRLYLLSLFLIHTP